MMFVANRTIATGRCGANADIQRGIARSSMCSQKLAQTAIYG